MTKIKKTTCIILALAAATFFTACSADNNEVEIGITGTEKDDIIVITVAATSEKDPVLIDSTVGIEETAEITSTTTVTEGYIYPDNEEEKLALIDKFEGESFIAPDGNKINKNQAADAFEYEYFDGRRTICLKFDSGYIRYAKPVFKSTLDEPPIEDWENSEWSKFRTEKIDNPNYFQVKAGDVLENGLTVTSAFYQGYCVENLDNGDSDCVYLEVKKSEIRLDGEVTMEGILYCHTDSIDNYTKYLLFFPDSVKCDTVMLPADYFWFKDASLASTFSYLLPEEKVGFYHDGTPYSLGDINNAQCSLAGLFDENNSCVRVKATIDNIVLSYGTNGDSVTAELVSAEKI